MTEQVGANHEDADEGYEAPAIVVEGTLAELTLSGPVPPAGPVTEDQVPGYQPT